MIEEIKKELDEASATFDDLIDAAVQAYKDGLLRSIAIENCSILITKNDYGKRHYKKGLDSYSVAINWINSLYTETFVIESEGDMCKFNNDIDSIILANGEDIIDIVMFNRNEPYFTNGGASAVKVPFSVLKGATVTQKRG